MGKVRFDNIINDMVEVLNALQIPYGYQCVKRRSEVAKPLIINPEQAASLTTVINILLSFVITVFQSMDGAAGQII